MILFLLISSIALFVASNLVKKNQENRSQAGFAGDTVRGLCKAVCTVNIPHLISGKTEACNKMCESIVFSCGTLASVDNVRSSVCYKECKVALAAYSSITENNVDQDCNNFCKAVISPVANFLKCTDEKCTELKGECVASLKAADGSSCTLKNGVKGTVQSNKCLSQASMDKKCCVPNTTAKINGVCGASKNACKIGTFKDVTDNNSYYKWNCEGSNGGSTANCLLRKTISSSCSSKGGVCIGSFGGVKTGIKCVSGGKNGSINTNFTCDTGKVCCVIK